MEERRDALGLCFQREKNFIEVVIASGGVATGAPSTPGDTA